MNVYPMVHLILWTCHCLLNGIQYFLLHHGINYSAYHFSSVNLESFYRHGTWVLITEENCKYSHRARLVAVTHPPHKVWMVAPMLSFTLSSRPSGQTAIKFRGKCFHLAFMQFMPLHVNCRAVMNHKIIEVLFGWRLTCCWSLPLWKYW